MKISTTIRTVLASAVSGLVLAAASSAATLYVDCDADAAGAGTEASPFNSLNAAIAAAAAGDTICAKGSLLVADTNPCVVIPADKTGLTITGWEDQRLALEVADGFITNGGGGTNVITVCAEGCTISGIDFTYHKNSLGLDKKGSAEFVNFRAQNGTLRDCSFFKPASEKPAYGGAGAIVGCAPSGAEYLLVEKCHFENIYGYRGDVNRDAIAIGNYATVRHCVFTNCWGMLAPAKNDLSHNYLVVSNVVFLAEADDGGYISRSGANVGVFWSAYNGLGGGEIAYNVIVGTDRSQSVFGYKTWQGFRSGTVLFHHNTVVGLSCLVAGGSNKQNGANNMTLHAFDNVLDMDVLFFENTSVAGTGKKVSHIKAGSLFKNNAYHIADETIIAEGAATESEEYNLVDALDFANNYSLASPPVFRVTDLASPGFYVPKTRDNPTWATKNRALTSLGVVAYPDFIGARKYIPPVHGIRLEMH